MGSIGAVQIIYVLINYIKAYSQYKDCASRQNKNSIISCASVFHVRNLKCALRETKSMLCPPRCDMLPRSAVVKDGWDFDGHGNKRRKEDMEEDLRMSQIRRSEPGEVGAWVSRG